MHVPSMLSRFGCTACHFDACTFHVVEVWSHSCCGNGLIIALLLKGQPKEDIVSHRRIVYECRLWDISNLHIIVLFSTAVNFSAVTEQSGDRMHDT